jgi:hypothetical protein
VGKLIMGFYFVVFSESGIIGIQFEGVTKMSDGTSVVTSKPHCHSSDINRFSIVLIISQNISKIQELD